MNYSAYNLPPGLSIDPVTGAISGIPAATGWSQVTVRYDGTLGPDDVQPRQDRPIGPVAGLAVFTGAGVITEQEQQAYNRAYQRRHRWDWARGIWFRTRRPLGRLLICVPGRHASAGHMSIIAALSARPSNRCRWCNRLIRSESAGRPKGACRP